MFTDTEVLSGIYSKVPQTCASVSIIWVKSYCNSVWWSWTDGPPQWRGGGIRGRRGGGGGGWEWRTGCVTGWRWLLSSTALKGRLSAKIQATKGRKWGDGGRGGWGRRGGGEGRCSAASVCAVIDRILIPNWADCYAEAEVSFHELFLKKQIKKIDKNNNEWNNKKSEGRVPGGGHIRACGFFNVLYFWSFVWVKHETASRFSVFCDSSVTKYQVIFWDWIFMYDYYSLFKNHL